MDNRAFRVAALVVLAAVAGGLWMTLLTRNGLVIGPDSTAYVGAAQNVADGKGLTLPFVPDTVQVHPDRGLAYDGAAPLYHYSPLLPAVLGVAVWIGIPATRAARVLNVFACALTTALLAWAVLRLTRRSAVAASIAVLFFLTTQVATFPLTSVATEALFVPLCIVALALLVRWLAVPRWWWGVAFVTVAAAATLARTVGVAVIATGVIAVALWFPASPRRRLTLAIAIGGASAIPALAWRQYDASGVGELAYHPPSLLMLRNTISSWLSGKSAVSWPIWLQDLALFATIAAIVTAVVLLRRIGMTASESPVNNAIVRVAALFATAYTVMLYLTITFLVITVPFGTRYIMPVLPPAIFLVIVAGWKVLREQRVRAVRWMTAAVAILLLAAVSVWHVEAARDSWRTSDVRLTRRPSGFLDAIRKLPPGSAVFTNAPQFVYERTRRFAVTLPPRTSIWSGDPNPDYSRDRAAIGPALCRHAGVVALANGYLMAGGGAVAARDLGEATNLEVTQRFPEGIIMRVDPARCS